MRRWPGCPCICACSRQLADQGTDTVSSQALAEAAGVNSAQLRKDLSHLGSYGTRGVGYEVQYLLRQIGREVGSAHDWPVIIVGLGNLGTALANYSGFYSRGFRVVGLIDPNPELVGRRIHGLAISDLVELEDVVARTGAAIAVIATPAEAAQAVADRLVYLGVTSILNFAPTVLVVPEGVSVRKVDLGQELQILAYHEQRSSEDPAHAYAKPRESCSMSILVVSVSHRSTSVAHLADLALDPAGSTKLADQLVSLRAHRGGGGAFDLQPDRALRVGLALPRCAGRRDQCARRHGRAARSPELQARCSVFFDEGAVAHTFAVAAGLDSLVDRREPDPRPGEARLDRVPEPRHRRQRPQLACSSRHSGSASGCRPRPRSAAPAARWSARRTPADRGAWRARGPRVLVVGAGAMAGLAARTAAAAGAQVSCANRTLGAGAAAAERSAVRRSSWPTCRSPWPDRRARDLHRGPFADHTAG